MAKQCSHGGGRPLLATARSALRRTDQHAGSPVAQGWPWKQVNGLGQFGWNQGDSSGPTHNLGWGLSGGSDLQSWKSGKNNILTKRQKV